ncbi:ABC transporter ATP-binding protein/permease [bacterium]|nr:ABC transporter ATP-binding protein/permease [bacterium]
MASTETGIFERRFIQHLRRLTRIYWTSADRTKGAGLLALCIAGELGTVYGNVQLAQAQATVFNAVQNKEATAFLTAMQVFLAVALLVVFVSTYRIYVRNILQIRWRERLTDHFLGDWIGPRAFWQRELHHKEYDNPDQRIAEDVQTYVASALGLSLSLLSAVATLLSFSGILWRLSGEWPLRLGTHEIWIPGLMMWVAILYALAATWLTNRVGRALVSINFNRLRFEADFRYGLVRYRDHVEAVSISRGDAVERQGALGRFRNIVANWWALITAQRNLTLLTSGIGQANGVVPLLVAAPAFFAGRMTLGQLTETGIAYGQVSGALSWFVDAYQEIANWRASVERLAVFQDVLDRTREELGALQGIEFATADRPQMHLAHLALRQPDGTAIASGLEATVAAGERVAMVGTAGVLKTTLFRALAGLWPFGSGRIELPAEALPLYLPSQPYLPIGTLREAVTYPSPAEAFPDQQVRGALAAVGLESLAGRLDESEPWEQQLPAEQQLRLTIARAILHQPDWVVLDDATAGLDQETERRVYTVLRERLPKSGILSLSTRPGVAEYHGRSLSLAATALAPLEAPPA